MSPLEVIQVALTRRSLAGGEAHAPEQAIRLPELIAAYTIGGAWLSRTEGTTGSIEAGKAADLVVLDQNLFDVPPAELRRVRVLLTLLGGRRVHRDPSFAWPAP